MNFLTQHLVRTNSITKPFSPPLVEKVIYKKLIFVMASLSIAVPLTLASVDTALAVSGAVYTTVNEAVDGPGHCQNGNPAVNCNIYDGKEYVWLNGGPASNGLSPDGTYFFAVLEPGGQSDPNDGGAKNLSDDYDAYTNRTFTVHNGEVSAYGGTHDLDSGVHPLGSPDILPPFIRLMPYADTPNPGGEYIMAICLLSEEGASQGGGKKAKPSGLLPGVDPKDCKYDAFKIKEEKVTLHLEGSIGSAEVCDQEEPSSMTMMIEPDGTVLSPGWSEARWIPVTGTVKVTDDNGDPVSGVIVTFSSDGTGDNEKICPAGSLGNCDPDSATSPQLLTTQSDGTISFVMLADWPDVSLTWNKNGNGYIVPPPTNLDIDRDYGILVQALLATPDPLVLNTTLHWDTSMVSIIKNKKRTGTGHCLKAPGRNGF